MVLFPIPAGTSLIGSRVRSGERLHEAWPHVSVAARFGGSALKGRAALTGKSIEFLRDECRGPLRGRQPLPVQRWEEAQSHTTRLLALEAGLSGCSIAWA